MLLKDCPVLTPVRLVSFECPTAQRLRMQELGLRPGMQLVVIQKAAFGGRVINIRGSRVAVDAASSRRMEVEILAPAPDDERKSGQERAHLHAVSDLAGPAAQTQPRSPAPGRGRRHRRPPAHHLPAPR